VLDLKTHHSDDLGLHLPDTRKDVWVQGIADGKHSVSVCLEIQHFLSAMIDGSGDLAVFPFRMMQFTQPTISAHTHTGGGGLLLF
jgi:hypothetical protein